MASASIEEEKMAAAEQSLPMCTDDIAISTTTILDLNDDCLRKICEHLDLAGLCSFADVCSRFKQAAQSHFGFKKLGDITGLDWICLTNRSQYSLLRNFDSSISSLTIINSTGKSDFLVEIIVRYCSALLNSMSLGYVHFNQEEDSVKKLQPLLSRLQKLDVHGCNFAPLLFDMLPSCAPELREFKLDRGLYGSRGKFKTFPKLETFSIQGFVDEDFEGFLEKNQQLKTIEVGSGGSRNFFELLAKFVPSIKNLTVSRNFAIPSVASLRNFSALKKLALYLSTILRTANLFNNLAAAQVPIEFLELRHGNLNVDLVSSISKLRKIETLRLVKISYLEQSLLEMCSNLGELTELYLLPFFKSSSQTDLGRPTQP